MSRNRYTSRTRQYPVQTQPPRFYILNQPRRGARVLRTNRYPTGADLYYDSRMNYSTNPYFYQPPRYYNPVVNRPRIIYDSNYQPVYDRAPQRVYPRQQSQIRSRSCSNRRQSRYQQQQQANPRRPRPLQLNDFMPTEFRNVSPRLPAAFNLINTGAIPSTTTPLPIVTDSTPVNTGHNSTDTLRQAAVSVNTTQPFMVNNQEASVPEERLQQQQQQPQQNHRPQQQQQSQQARHTASFSRRLQRRNLSPNNRMIGNSNRFALLREDNDEVEDLLIVDEDADELSSEINNDNNTTKKKEKKKSLKTPSYLDYNRFMTSLRNNGKAKEIESSSGNHAFVVHSLPAYDRWVRDHYELQVWQQYLDLGNNQQYWPKEVVQRTNKQDNVSNRKFVIKKINLLSSRLAQTNITITNLRSRLGTYWSQVPRLVTSSELPSQGDTVTEAAAASGRTTTSSTISKTVRVQSSSSTYANLGPDRIRKKISENENVVLDYLYESTKHIRKRAELRIEVAKGQLNEYKALENFLNVATPAHFSIHEIVKIKMRLWSTKNKKRQAVNKRMELDLPAKFITSINFKFQLDESLFNRQEAQEFYDEMNTITKRYRTEALRIYQEAALREFELVSIGIRQLLDSLQQSTHEDEISATAFKQYHKLRETRLNLEAEQSVLYLFEQQAESELDDSLKSMEAVNLTSAQVLRDDFLLQS